MEDGVRTHEQTVQNQFNPRAEAYLTSAVHAAGPDLERAKALVAQAVASDFPGSGPRLRRRPSQLRSGTARRPHGRARSFAGHARRGITGRPRQGPGPDRGPAGQRGSATLRDCSFDLVCTRYSAHHWTRLDEAVRSSPVSSHRGDTRSSSTRSAMRIRWSTPSCRASNCCATPPTCAIAR